jgi:peptide/nickel transport system substrate-binding protein
MQDLTRREFLRISALATAGVAAAACAKTAEPTTPPEATATQPPAATATQPPAAATATPEPAAATSKEAPMLSEKVQAGSLPPLEERLPSDPKVTPVEEEIGQYGGIWHRVAVGRSSDRRMGDRLTYQDPVRWKSATDVSEVLPHIVSSFEINPEGTEFIFHLRAGHKWSDGRRVNPWSWKSWTT